MGEWTGGIANREYRRGTRTEPVLTEELRRRLAGQVKNYLADARKFRLKPSEERCLAVVYTANDKQKKYVADEYRRLTGSAPRG